MEGSWGWKEFGKVRCINLYTRDDRYQSSMVTFNSLDIPVNYFRTHKHPQGGARGCFESHRAVIRDAYASGVDTLLVFEDDLLATKWCTPARLAEVLDFLKSNQDWTIFFLGISPDILSSKTSHVQGNIYGIHGLMTHAYVVSRKGMKLLNRLTYRGVPIDQIYKHIPECYSIYPSMFTQLPGVSDIGGDPTSTLDVRSSVQQAVEWYSVNVNVPVSVWIFLGVTTPLVGACLLLTSLAWLWILVIMVVYFCLAFVIISQPGSG